MTFRIRHFFQCQTIYHAKIHYQLKNDFFTIKNARFTASPVFEVLDAPYCMYYVAYVEHLLEVSQTSFLVSTLISSLIASTADIAVS